MGLGGRDPPDKRRSVRSSPTGVRVRLRLREVKVRGLGLGLGG